MPPPDPEADLVTVTCGGRTAGSIEADTTADVGTTTSGGQRLRSNTLAGRALSFRHDSNELCFSGVGGIAAISSKRRSLCISDSQDFSCLQTSNCLVPCAGT
mmetsp:Transcript_131565/g.293449  ORF Transcript_131565/g.293449 Transcript_131565/m.293449 type:complete len:102 (+) Transcript_131565:382-687(+)